MSICSYNKNISANALLFDSEGFMNNVGGMVMIIYNELKMKTNYNCTLTETLDGTVRWVCVGPGHRGSLIPRTQCVSPLVDGEVTS